MLIHHEMQTMKRSIIITDLTRFKPGNPDLCTAGIDRETGECIRPMPYLKFAKCMELGILPGGILSGEFTPLGSRTAPHTEDCQYEKLSFHGPCCGEEFRSVLAESCFPSVETGFEVSLAIGEKVIPPDHKVQRSIITLQVDPRDIEIVENSYKPGSIRLHFIDSVGRRHRYFPITDLGFFDYAQRHRDSSALTALNIEIAKQKEIFLRIGLSRRYRSPQGKDGFWMQANGIYTFPKILSYIRSYTEPESNQT
ncbi:MAG: hypothetical protein JJU00_01175 [Opitutales bacterium]|nr:hypothetical protein [Opitutales bacterium]